MTAKMKHGSILFAAILLTVAALEDVSSSKPPADMLPPAPFPLKTTSSPTTHNVTTAKLTTTTPAHKTTTTKSTTTKSTTTPSHKRTTAKTTTTTAPHKTTTAKTTTTTPPHKTTTAKTTTTTPPHNTTTAKTSTTTSSPEPTPQTNVTVGNYTVKNGNQLCVMVQSVIQVKVNNDKTSGNYIVQPSATTVNGSCTKTSAELNLFVKEGSISMTFTMNNTVVYVSSVAVSLTYAFKKGAVYSFVEKNDSVQLFSMQTSHSYSCKSESIYMGNGTVLMFSQNRMQAFNFTNNQFGPIDMCKADKPDYRIAVGVGVVLLILIIIVVLAYIISRRKRTDGYQSL